MGIIDFPMIYRVLIENETDDIIRLAVICHSEADALTWNNLLEGYAAAWQFNSEDLFCLQLHTTNGFYSVKTGQNIKSYPLFKWLDKVNAIASAYQSETGQIHYFPSRPLVQ